MEIKSIGIIHSPYSKENKPPKQGYLEKKISKIEIFAPYKDACLGLEENKKYMVLYWQHLGERDLLQLVPKHSTTGELKGVFATRSPARPNPIALCCVKLVKINEDSLEVYGLDAFDGSEVIDIKAYIDYERVMEKIDE